MSDLPETIWATPIDGELWQGTFTDSGKLNADAVQYTRTDTIPTWHNLKIRQLNERYVICKKAVDDHDGNIVHAAKSIKIGRRQLYRELARGLLVPTPSP